MPVASASPTDKAWEQMRDLGVSVREMSVRAATISEEDRSFEATVSTEIVAKVADVKNWRVIDEILLTRGAAFPEYLPLLDDHDRRGSKAVIGSARGFRQDGGQWVGRAYVAKPANDLDDVSIIWSRVKDGHLRAVSLGYLPTEFIDIEPGRSEAVAGKTYRAQDRVLRVTTKWQPFELSLTPIGADRNALIRSLMGEHVPAPRKRSYFL